MHSVEVFQQELLECLPHCKCQTECQMRRLESDTQLRRGRRMQIPEAANLCKEVSQAWLSAKSKTFEKKLHKWVEHQCIDLWACKSGSQS